MSLAEGVLRTMFLTRLKTLGSLVLAVLLIGVGAALFGSRLAVAEGPLRTLAAYAPNAAPAEHKPPDKVREAIDRGVAYLKKSQTNSGWEQDPRMQGMKGGATALALLALLESGLKADDPVVAKGLDYLREIEPTQTYVVSLQTAVFCRGKRMKDRELIQRNVDWLLAARCRVSGGPLLGWTYTRSNSRTADNSNTQFAVLALDAGHDAGAKVHKKDWQEIR